MGNKVITNGSLPKLIESMHTQLKPEAVYFLPQEGVRTSVWYFDMKNPAQIPVIFEPLFQELHATVEITPAMNMEDLKAGLKQLNNSR
jgi:hypothetical protein